MAVQISTETAGDANNADLNSPCLCDRWEFQLNQETAVRDPR
jgi:hypothetical protein